MKYSEPSLQGHGHPDTNWRLWLLIAVDFPNVPRAAHQEDPAHKNGFRFARVIGKDPDRVGHVAGVIRHPDPSCAH